MRYAATCLVMLFAVGCGGEPVGAKVPRPDPATVAVGAAAAAAALTLANPDAAGRKPEGQTEKSLKGVKGPKETVPSSVLDRADSKDQRPCAPSPDANAAVTQPAAPGHIDLIPAPENPERTAPVKATEPCPKNDDDSDDEDGAGD